MKKTIFILFAYLFSSYSFGQTTITINYPSASACGNNSACKCNYFSSTADPREIGGIKHWPTSGGCQFDGSVITMPTHYDIEPIYGTPNTNSINEGTAFSLKYSFKKNYNYTISIDAGYNPETSAQFPAMILIAWDVLPDPNNTNPSGCGSVSEYTATLGGSVIDNFYPGIGTYPNYGSIKTRTTQFQPNSNFEYLTITAFGHFSPSTTSAKVKKIVINESLPFTITPQSLALQACVSNPQTFQISNTGTPTGVISYNWHTAGGWFKSDGITPAPPTITTDASTPSLTLVPNPIAPSISNVTVDVLINGVVKGSYTCFVNYTPPVFTISQTSNDFNCNISQPQTLTVNNVNNSPCNLIYVWNLGSATNGWLYNGSTAPQIITTSTNSLQLSSAACVNNLNNISVDVKIDNVTFKTLNTTVNLIQPTLSVIGSNLICTSSTIYSVQGLACGASVIWSSASPEISITQSPGSNQCTVAKQSDGVAYLKASITGSGCINTQEIVKQIQVGTVPKPYLVDMQLSAINTSTRWSFVAPFYDNVYYTWYINGGAQRGLAENYIEVNVPCNERVSVACKIRNTCGFSAISDTKLTDIGYCQRPVVIGPDPNDLDILQYADRRIGQIQKKNNIIYLYPNPAKSFVTLQMDKLVGEGQIIVTNLLGKQVKIQPLSVGSNKIDIANLSKGFYFVGIITSEGKTTQKLIIE